MRTPRIVILAAFLFTTITLSVLFLRSSHSDSTYSTRGSESASGSVLFSFHTPLALFPPNAIISLTDDNTTSFLARPAAFGPLLPAKGLSGELWIGSGFGDDSLRQGAIVVGAEGELGCSDVPGWVDGKKKVTPAGAGHKLLGHSKAVVPAESAKTQRRDGGNGPAGYPESGRDGASEPSMYDGTDDYLHHPLPGSSVSKPSNPGQNLHSISTSQTNHADIQSIQEGAEIAGKIVLLSRGGCGFLEKVKWAQRRGGVALIVGDNTRGGPLIQMYARGDTSNVTIPSIFTSHTTAHLLSSLIPSGTFIEDTIDENGKVTTKVQQSSHKPKSGRKKGSKHGGTSDASGKAATTRPASKLAPPKSVGATEEKSAPPEIQEIGWFASLFSKHRSTTEKSNGQLDWVIVDDWDEADEASKKSSPKAASDKSHHKDNVVKVGSDDDFEIGIQDWRDPDLVDSPASIKASKENVAVLVDKKGTYGAGGANKKQPAEFSSDGVKSSLGGSITPGSGEYKDGLPAVKTDIKGSKGEGARDKSVEKDKSGLLSKIFGDDDEEVYAEGGKAGLDVDGEDEGDEENDDDSKQPEHEGLWVTLTPTTGASPFFDTLLVLVVSPLVTLTVVYALLLLRSRIRRRRWRAPKSVVERLPVRTYQTVASSHHSRLPSPTSSSPTTPLLQHNASRSRPRSRTTSGLPEPGLLLRTNSDSAHSSRTPSRGHEHEKGGSLTSEWKKYMGKQVECVVCLEEYVDGVSRVMSLPCGHEFHVECITPWLTTRRRTCPICKGDVVRSLARGSPSGPRYESYRDEIDDEVQVPMGQPLDDHPTAAVPIVRDSTMFRNPDLERGVRSSTPSRSRLSHRTGSWRSMLSLSLGSGSSSPAPTHQDRSR